MADSRPAISDVTADALFEMRDDGFRRELVRGEVRTMTPTGGLHGVVVAKITIALGQYVDAHHLGCLLGAETGFKLAAAPDTLRAADVSFVRRERIPESGIPEKFWPGAPDLAVEVLSPDDRVREVDDKVDDWLLSGTREVWIVSPHRRSVTVHRVDVPPVTLRETDQITGGECLPGSLCRVAAFFPVAP